MEANSASPDQAFTGERFLPDVIAGPIRFEHLHRYAVAGLFTHGKTVLDIACGDGYGAALMAGQGGAIQVVGVDIDEPTIERARLRYAGSAAISFLAGSTDAIPLPDASVDCVVSFETIEHHDRHSLMLQEFDRVLRPGGIVVLSSPNRPVYSEGRGYTNPFHVKELDGAEFVGVLRERFPAVKLWGQKLRGASFLYPVTTGAGDFGGLPAGSFGAFSPAGDSEWGVKPDVALEAPMYFLAVCARSESDLPSPVLLQSVPSIFADPADDLIQSEIARIAKEMAQGYENELASRAAELARTQGDFRAVRAEADGMLEQVRQVEELRHQLAQANQQLNEWETGPYGKLRRTVRGLRGTKSG